MNENQGFNGVMDRKTVYEWGALFACSWPEIVSGMRSRADQVGLVQVEGDRCVDWKKEEKIKARFLFVDDPSDITAIRRIYNDDTNLKMPACFIVVRQPDPTEMRGDIIFDIFKMSPESYLWHFYRVYTPPKRVQG